MALKKDEMGLCIGLALAGDLEGDFLGCEGCEGREEQQAEREAVAIDAAVHQPSDAGIGEQREADPEWMTCR